MKFIIHTNSFSVLTAKVYPIFASYKAYVEYTLANKNYQSGTFNIAGVSIAVSSLLKKATSDTSDLPDEAIVLMYQSNKLNKWLVFWIVNSSFELCSSILFLKYVIPFYSLIRFSISIWFLVPLMKPVMLDNYNSNEDLNNFFNSGCGLCFKTAISNSEQQLTALNNLNTGTGKLKEVINTMLDILILKTPLGAFISFNNSNNAKSTDEIQVNTPSYDYIGALKAFGSSRVQNILKTSSPDVVEEEYDVIDNPTAKTSATSEKDAIPGQRKGWLW